MKIVGTSRIGKKRMVFRKEVMDTVGEIFETVAKDGDKAVFACTKKYDNVMLKKENVQVSKREIKSAYKALSKKQIDAIKKAAKHIRKFCEMELKCIKTFSFRYNGNLLGELAMPIESVGCYIPAGKFPLPSTVLMCVIPAKVAGVKEITISTPPVKRNGIVTANESVIVTADILRVNKIYKIGGAQAIAAMAFGTASIQKVDKIVGPGNAYVSAAKKLAYGYVDVDSIAGPTELMIIADVRANPRFVAADILAEAEHGKDTVVVLVTPSTKLANAVDKEVTRQVEKLETKKTILESLDENGKLIIAKDLDECFEIANNFAPEHLEIMIKNAKNYMKRIKNAGGVFIGDYSSSVFGDYISGTNHVLPTSGMARVKGGLSVRDFIKFTSYQEIDKRNIMKLIKPAYEIAKLEGLEGHAQAVKIRGE